jgi:hypothetical protein
VATNPSIGWCSFALAEIDAEQRVSVVGDFNEWDPLANPLEQDDSGRHSVILELPAGASYHFKYLADDGTWFCDPDVAERELNEYGELNSLLQMPRATGSPRFAHLRQFRMLFELQSLASGLRQRVGRNRA